MTTTSPPTAHKEWAKYLQKHLGGSALVTAFKNEDGTATVPIFTSENSEGIVSATIGLMDIDQSSGVGKHIYTEVLMDARGHETSVANVVATIAFFIRTDGWRVAPGVVFERVVAINSPTMHLPHVFFATPFQWGDDLSKVVLNDRTIYPLLAIPISDRERKFALDEGASALENVWEKNGTDVLDWSRQSAV